MESWEFLQTSGNPARCRDCTRIAKVPVDDDPALDFASSLLVLDGRWGLLMYAESEQAARLARVLERLAGPSEMKSVWAMYRDERQRSRIATVQGNFRIADGSNDPAFAGGLGGFKRDVDAWKRRDLAQMPVQVGRLLELEGAGVDVVDFPSSPAAHIRWPRLHLGQPAVVSMTRLRRAQEAGLVTVSWTR